MENANINDVAVFKLTASPLNMYVNNVNIVIPQTNATNLPGQKLPSNPAIVSLVASMNIYVIGTPSTANANLYFFNTGHNIGPFSCIHTTACPAINNNIENVINR